MQRYGCYSRKNKGPNPTPPPAGCRIKQAGKKHPLAREYASCRGVAKGGAHTGTIVSLRVNVFFENIFDLAKLCLAKN